MKTRLLLSAAIAMFGSSTALAQGAAPANAPQYINSRGALSAAVRVGNMLYLSGQLGRGNDSTQQGIGPETKAAMEKIKALLEANGSSLDRVVKCTVFLVDMNEWAAMNAEYTKFFAADKRPARSAIGTSGLVQNARVEIECMAAVG